MHRKSQKVLEAAKYKINHPELSATAVAKLYSVDKTGLIKTLESNDLNYPVIANDGYCYFFNDHELAILEYFKEHPEASISGTKKMFNSPIKRGTLKHWIEILSIKHEPYQKYHYNRNAFASIVNEEDAYWLGFITADGYINEQHNWLNIGLAEIDLLHIKKFLKYLQFPANEAEEIIRKGTGGAYTKDNVVYQITVCGKKLVENLKQYGLFQAKSGREKPYICATKELEIAYLRGLLDGDGYIRSTQYGVGLVGSYEITKYFVSFICRQLGIENYEGKYIGEHGKIYKAAFSGRIQSQKILNILYSNATIYLDRKFDLYRSYCRV